MADLYVNPWQENPAPTNPDVRFYYKALCKAIDNYNVCITQAGGKRSPSSDFWMDKILQWEDRVFSLLDSLEGRRLLEEAGEVDRGPITEPAPLAEDEAPEEWKPLYRPPTSSS